MLRSIADLRGYEVVDADEVVGRVDDVYFSDEDWTVRHLAIEMGGRSSHRRVLVSPQAVEAARAEGRLLEVALPAAAPSALPPNSRLPSARDVIGYHIAALDGDIGHVADFIVDDDDWVIRYLVVDTRNWWFGKKVLVAPQWASSIDWSERKVNLELARDTIKNSPEWDANAPVNREYEVRLYDYYGRPVYWSGERIQPPSGESHPEGP